MSQNSLRMSRSVLLRTTSGSLPNNEENQLEISNAEKDHTHGNVPIMSDAAEVWSL